MKNLIIIGAISLICNIGSYGRQPVMQSKFYDPSLRLRIDSLRAERNDCVSPGDSPHELAALLALGHYPELKDNKIVIRIRKNVRHPITASYSFLNFFKLKKGHTYILLIKPGSFIDRIDLNKKVALIGHEMAHFLYYKERPAIAMIPWGLRYVFSRKFRRKFERGADFVAIDHGLGWQLLNFSMYISREEVMERMDQSRVYDPAL